MQRTGYKHRTLRGERVSVQGQTFHVDEEGCMCLLEGESLTPDAASVLGNHPNYQADPSVRATRDRRPKLRPSTAPMPPASEPGLTAPPVVDSSSPCEEPPVPEADEPDSSEPEPPSEQANEEQQQAAPNELEQSASNDEPTPEEPNSTDEGPSDEPIGAEEFAGWAAEDFTAAREYANQFGVTARSADVLAARYAAWHENLTDTIPTTTTTTTHTTEHDDHGGDTPSAD